MVPKQFVHGLKLHRINEDVGVIENQPPILIINSFTSGAFYKEGWGERTIRPIRQNYSLTCTNDLFLSLFKHTFES